MPRMGHFLFKDKCGRDIVADYRDCSSQNGSPNQIYNSQTKRPVIENRIVGKVIGSVGYEAQESAHCQNS